MRAGRHALVLNRDPDTCPGTSTGKGLLYVLGPGVGWQTAGSSCHHSKLRASLPAPLPEALLSSGPSLPDRKSLNPPEQCELATLPGPLSRGMPHSAPGYRAPYCLSRGLPDFRTRSSSTNSPGMSLLTAATPFSPIALHRRSCLCSLHVRDCVHEHLPQAGSPS